MSVFTGSVQFDRGIFIDFESAEWQKLYSLKQRKAPKSLAIYSQVIIHFIILLLSTLLSTVRQF